MSSSGHLATTAAGEYPVSGTPIQISSTCSGLKRNGGIPTFNSSVRPLRSIWWIDMPGRSMSCHPVGIAVALRGPKDTSTRRLPKLPSCSTCPLRWSSGWRNWVISGSWSRRALRGKAGNLCGEPRCWRCAGNGAKRSRCTRPRGGWACLWRLRGTWRKRAS